MVDTVGVEPTSRGGFMPAFHNATYPYKLVGRAGFEPAKLYKSHARLNLIEIYHSESRVLADSPNTVKHGVTVRVFGHFTTYPILNFIGCSSNSIYHSSAHIASTTK